MSQTIKRGGKSVRKAAAAQGKARQVRVAKAKTGSAVDAAMSWVPLSEAQLHRLFLAMILGGAVALAWIVASFAGLPLMAQQQLAVISGNAGFEVRNISVRGTKNLNELKVYELALADNRRAMPFLDLDAVRDRLMSLSWVEDARVSRQLPDTLVIDIVERKPVAVLRKVDRLVLIDAKGTELEVVAPERAKGKLVISGSGAGQQVEALAALLDAAPALKPQVAEAEWVGNRRWNLKFKTGQVLALPQGEAQSHKALMTFARLDGTNRLLGGKVVAFDMRAPDRVYLRVPGRTDPVEQQTANTAAVAEISKKEAAAKAEAKTGTEKQAETKPAKAGQD
ncbi:cell division protein FtsQ/DivIB [Novosphingobium sp.]|uniref:cell division protein FtsQ/DivIB n=1 Tax=Novosphingobium sp. TaxID=1874826 RepID=UPI0035B3EFC3